MAEGLHLDLDNKAWLAGLVPIGTLDILEMLQLLVSDLHELLCDPKLTAWSVLQVVAGFVLAASASPILFLNGSGAKSRMRRDAQFVVAR